MTHYYRRHVFVCENRRDGEKCCADNAVAEPVKHLRAFLKEQGAHGKGRVRVNRAGCFDRCPLGPVLVVYPDAVWYRYDSPEDLREIAESHLLRGEPVQRLRLPDGDGAVQSAANGGVGESDNTNTP